MEGGSLQEEQKRELRGNTTRADGSRRRVRRESRRDSGEPAGAAREQSGAGGVGKGG